MAFIPVPNCVQARIQFLSTTSVFAENVLYFATSGVPTPTDLEEIGSDLYTWLLDSLMPVTANIWSATGVNLRAMNEEEGISAFFNDGFPIAGGGGAVPAPNNVSYTVTWSTGLVGRSARGRSYGVGVVNSNTVNGNRLSDAARDALQLRWEALRADMATAGHALQVVSFFEGGVPRTEGRKLVVLSTNVRFPLATQRRRLS